MKPMVSMAGKPGAREMPAEDQLDAARRELGMAHPELPGAGFRAQERTRSRESAGRGSATPAIALPPEHSAAASDDKTG
ncbi:MAG TPA: hypothetical protein VGM79_09400 [Streptosporangiaceae bacterium]|jgi:hypothetical protein